MNKNEVKKLCITYGYTARYSGRDRKFFIANHNNKEEERERGLRSMLDKYGVKYEFLGNIEL